MRFFLSGARSSFLSPLFSSPLRALPHVLPRAKAVPVCSCRPPKTNVVPLALSLLFILRMCAAAFGLLLLCCFGPSFRSAVGSRCVQRGKENDRKKRTNRLSQLPAARSAAAASTFFAASRRGDVVKQTHHLFTLLCRAFSSTAATQTQPFCLVRKVPSRVS